MNYSEIKKLDEKTLEKLTEGVGPSDECLCSLLAPPDEDKKRGVRASIKKAFASLGVGKSGRKKNYEVQGRNSVDIPLTFTKGGKGIFTRREEIERTSSCGKCGCDNDKVFLKHSYANIRITAPDIDMESICSCPSNCMPQLKEKLQSSIKVTVEHVTLDQDSDSHLSSYQPVGRSFSDLTEETLGESERGEDNGEERETGEETGEKREEELK